MATAVEHESEPAEVEKTEKATKAVPRAPLTLSPPKNKTGKRKVGWNSPHREDLLVVDVDAAAANWSANEWIQQRVDACAEDKEKAKRKRAEDFASSTFGLRSLPSSVVQSYLSVSSWAQRALTTHTAAIISQEPQLRSDDDAFDWEAVWRIVLWQLESRSSKQ